MPTLLSNMPNVMCVGVIMATSIWLLIDIVVAIKKKKSIWVSIGLFLVIISATLLILVNGNMLSFALLKHTPVAIFATSLSGAGIAIYGGFRDFKRAGKKTNPAIKRFFIGWGVFMTIGVIILIVAFAGKKMTGT